MILQLKRQYRDGYTPGFLEVEGGWWYTIERPWIPSPNHKGGMNEKSCVPEGRYIIRPYNSLKFPRSYILVNEDLDVYGWTEVERGRSAILIHSGNSVADVIGCIAVGKAHAADRRVVLKSRQALDELNSILGRKGHHELIIGVKDGSSGSENTGIQSSGAIGPSSDGVRTDVGTEKSPS